MLFQVLAQSVNARVFFTTLLVRAGDFETQVGADMALVSTSEAGAKTENSSVCHPVANQPLVRRTLYTMPETQMGDEVVQVGEGFAAGGDAHKPHTPKPIFRCCCTRSSIRSVTRLVGVIEKGLLVFWTPVWVKFFAISRRALMRCHLMLIHRSMQNC